MIYDIDKEDTSPSFQSVRFSKLQIFHEIFSRPNLPSPVWSRHVGVLLWDINMAAGK